MHGLDTARLRRSDVGVSDAKVAERLSQLVLLLPGLEPWLESAPPTLTARLVCRGTDEVVRRLMVLQALFPLADVTILVSNCPTLLLDDDLREVAAARERRKEEKRYDGYEDEDRLFNKWIQNEPWHLGPCGRAKQRRVPLFTDETLKMEAAVRALPAGAWVALPAPTRSDERSRSHAAYALLQLQEDSVVVVGATPRGKGARARATTVDGVAAPRGAALVRGWPHLVRLKPGSSVFSTCAPRCLTWRATFTYGYGVKVLTPVERKRPVYIYAASVIMAGVPVMARKLPKLPADFDLVTYSPGVQCFPEDVHHELLEAADRPRAAVAEEAAARWRWQWLWRSQRSPVWWSRVAARVQAAREAAQAAAGVAAEMKVAHRARRVEEAAAAAGVSDAEVDERLRQLARLLPGLEARLEGAPPTLIARLVCHTDTVAWRCVVLKALFPQADITILVSNRPTLLLDDDIFKVGAGNKIMRPLHFGGMANADGLFDKWVEEQPWVLGPCVRTRPPRVAPFSAAERMREAAVRALPAGAWVALPAPQETCPAPAAYALLRLEGPCAVAVAGEQGGALPVVDGAQAIQGATLVHGTLHPVPLEPGTWSALHTTCGYVHVPVAAPGAQPSHFYAASVLAACVPVMHTALGAGFITPEAHAELLDAAEIARAGVAEAAAAAVARKAARHQPATNSAAVACR
ncbi:hypothetical protein FOA52_003208 [Chlamydomonas sp. UWO 241]|nr:hypothetical protein FOA52_003208 [Chlamydomonas sp. UWO 241]